MSVTLKRSHATDSYDVLSSYTATSNQTEVAIVSSLVKGNLGTINGDQMTSPVNNTTWDYSQLDIKYVDTSAISNYPAGTLKEQSVISLTHNSPSQLKSYTVNIGNSQLGNSSTFEMLSSSSVVYDSNYVVNQSYLPLNFDNAVSNDGQVPQDAVWQTEMDQTNPNFPIQVAVNSEWNSIKPQLGYNNGLADVGVRPLAARESAQFNENDSLGGAAYANPPMPYSSKYATSSPDGSIQLTTISTNFQPLSNNMMVEDRTDYAGFDSTGDVGIFRNQQSLVNSVFTEVTLDNGSSQPVDTTLLTNMPIMDANAQNGVINTNTLKASLNAPGSMTAAQFYSLFNDEVRNTVADDYEFSVTISDNDAGYSIDESSILISSLNNDNLLSNPYYMENNVNDPHEIIFSDAGLNITPSTNGIQSNVSLMNIDLNAGETLTSTNAGVNGEIKLNINTINTRTTDFASVGANNPVQSDVNVDYASISSEMMTNPYLRINYDKVALRSSAEPLNNVFLSSNRAFLTMYTDKVANNLVDLGNTTFNFQNNFFTDDNVRLWRIEVQNNLVVEPESFYKGYDNNANNGIDLVKGLSIQSLLQNLTENLTEYESYRCELTAKTLQDIGLNNAVNDTNNWIIRYSNMNDLFLTSNSVIAFNDENSLPNYNMALINNINNGSDLHFTYEYLTQTNSATYGGLRDYVKVSYWLDNNSSNPTVFSIPQTAITRVYSALPTTTTNVVSQNYQLTGSIYTAEQWQLVSVTQTSEFNAEFSPNYGTFDNITLGINGLSQVDSYYALQNKTTSVLAPHTSLQYVIAPEISNLLLVNETITPTAGGSSTISGVFSRNDLKAFFGVVQGKKESDNNWVNVSNTVDFDTYYGLDNINNLTIPTVPGGPNVLTNIEFSPFTALEQVVNLNNLNYYIPFIYNGNDASWSISSFDSSPNDLPIYTNLSQDFNNFLTVEDNYAVTNLSSWSPSAYTVSVTNNANNVTVIEVKNTNGNTVFTITRESTLPFLGTMIVSYINQDIFRSRMYLGASELQTQDSPNILYQATNYTNSTLQPSNTPGVSVVITDTTTLAGSQFGFRVLGDFLSINLVGTIIGTPNNANELGNPSYNNGSLLFQYLSGPNYSGKITFDRYRGYGNLYSAAAGAIQTYTINRGSTVVTFYVGTALQQTLTPNMYFGESMTVNDLVNGSNVTCANLGVSFSANYSLHPTNALLRYPVTVRGDNVSIKISNPNYVGTQGPITVPPLSTPVANPNSYSASCTLKDYGPNFDYTFSGIYSVTSQLVALRPARVKMSNTAFPYSNLVYSIKFIIPPSYLYKALKQTINGKDYLGNPEMISSNDPNLSVDTLKWVQIKKFDTYADKLAGINLGRKILKQNPNQFVKEAISYFVSVRPYLEFEIVSTEHNLATPFNYTSLQSVNKKKIYLPYFYDVTVYKPFAPTIQIDDVLGNPFNITNDPTYVNNVTFTLLQPPTVLDMALNPDSTRYGIMVAGVKLNINLYTGLHNSTLQPHVLYDAPVTSMSSTLDVLNNYVVFRNRENDGAINFSCIQFPSDIGYPTGVEGYKTIFRTDNQSDYYNIDLKIGNACWYNYNSPITYFDANADGIRPTLYTVLNLNNPSDKLNNRRVYKYNSIVSFNIQDNTVLQTLSFSFSGRSYYDVKVITPPVSTNVNDSWDYMNLVANTNIPNADINVIPWTVDTNFSDTVYVNWSFGNSVTGTKMPIDLFFVENQQQKWVNIKLLPFQNLMNQYGLTVGGINWDGSVVAPLVSTQVVAINNQLSSPILTGETYQTEQYSVSTLMK